MKRLTPLTSLFLMAALSVSAQKLKDVQDVSLRAPSPIKIDGALTEWNDTFQAYNRATKLYYTMANDDKNIYLAFKSTDALNNNKITAGGITITINTDGKKKEKDAYTLTYPIVERPKMQRPQGGPGGGAGGVRVMAFGGPGPGGPMSPNGPDSAMIKAAHDRVIAASKEIKISGFKDIADSLISIYNEYGIKAAIGYNKLGNFTYELAIPLKYFGLTVDAAKEIAYNVKVNGLQINMRMDDGGGPGGPGGPVGGPVRDVVVMGGPRGGGGPGGNGMSTFQELTSPSDFWGKYTLAKK
ncbi:MAG TPA: hypothetical protein VL490_06475 [Mucilaginibacter sp.]|nr:hypothetical protein [Mucilaginibacter sp.]